MPFQPLDSFFKQLPLHEIPEVPVIRPDIVTEGWEVTAKNRVFSDLKGDLLTLLIVNEISAELAVREITRYFAAKECNAKDTIIIKMTRKGCLVLINKLLDIEISYRN